VEWVTGEPVIVEKKGGQAHSSLFLMVWIRPSRWRIEYGQIWMKVDLEANCLWKIWQVAVISLLVCSECASRTSAGSKVDRDSSICGGCKQDVDSFLGTLSSDFSMVDGFDCPGLPVWVREEGKGTFCADGVEYQFR